MIVDLIDNLLREFGYTVAGTAHNIHSARHEIAKRHWRGVAIDADKKTPEDHIVPSTTALTCPLLALVYTP